MNQYNNTTIQQKNSKNKKLAFVYDDLVQKGGGEKFFLNIVNLYPDSEIFVPIISNYYLKLLKGRKYTYSKFLSSLLVFKKPGYILASFLSIIWFEGLNLDKFNTVVSLCNRFSNVIITKPHTKHINIFTHPARILFESKSYNYLFSFLRIYLFFASKRADTNITISSFVKLKTQKLLNLQTSVLHPFINYEKSGTTRKVEQSNYFLIVGRCNKWKEKFFEKAVSQIVTQNRNIVLVGKDFLKSSIYKKYKNNSLITFTSFVTEETLCDLYSNCIALIHPQVEDFGLTPLECLHFNKPTLAFKKGGVAEFLNDKVCMFYSNSKEFRKCVENISKFKIDEKERLRILALHSPKNYKAQLDLIINSN